MALQVRLGGLGITNPTAQMTHQHSTSQKVTAPLAALILQQALTCPTEIKGMYGKAKSVARTTCKEQEAQNASELMGKLPTNLPRALKVSSKKGASSWLSTLPIAEHRFALHKEAFRDALCLRYGWCLSNLPTICVCGKPFLVEHALNCACGGLPSIWHNELRDITADLLTEVCHNVRTEPALQSLSQEQLKRKTANREDGSCLDVVAESFWGRDRQHAFFDVRFFNPMAQSHRNTPLAQCYWQNEQEKRAYDERVRGQAWHNFPPLSFQPLAAWDPLPLWYTEGLPPSWLRSSSSPTAEPCSGWDASWASRSCVQLSSCASEVHAHPSTTQLDSPILESPSTRPTQKDESPWIWIK